MVSFNADTYPYERVQTGASSFQGLEAVPQKILMYLLDLPDQYGYVPQDTNDRSRVRLAKYLWYDGAQPLENPLPTPTEKLSLLFDGEHPVLDTADLQTAHPKGYRLYAQEFWGQSQTVAQTTLKCYTGRVNPQTLYMANIDLYFEILCNVNQETTTRTSAYSRSLDIEQCILESLNGVNIAGIGVVEFSRQANTNCMSRYISDEGTNVGRQLCMNLSWANSTSLID